MIEHKKVVIVGPAHPLRGGLATYNERLAGEFESQGHEVSIYTFSLQYPGFLFPGKTQFSADPAPANLNIQVRINSVNPLNWFKVGRAIRRQKPDLVIFRYWIPFMAPCLGTIARVIRKNKYSKVVALIDNMIPHEKRIGDRLLSAYLVNSVDAFVSMSKSVLEDIQTFDKKKPKVYCPHPLYDSFGESIPKEEAKQLLGLDPASRYILFFGFIREYKGLDILLKAMALDKLSKMPVKLLVAGEFYTDPKPYFELVKELELQSKVVMNNDFIPDSEVYKYFCAADVVVQPYRNATQSGVTQIAYHFNKPMIISKVGGLQEFVPDGIVGYVVAPDPGEVSEAIIRFYEEDKEEEFSRNSAIEKQKYSWLKMVDSFLSLL